MWLFRTALHYVGYVGRYAEKERGLGDRYVIATVVTTESRDTAGRMLYSLSRSVDQR